MMTATRLDAAVIRIQADGKWREVLTRLGLDLPPTAKQHGPCPTCGGKDRFRFDDRDGRGTWFCNQCDPQAGDGFRLIQNVRGCEFPDALQLVADALGIATTPRSAGPFPSKKDSPRICDLPPGELEQSLFLYTGATGRPAIYVQRIELGEGKKVFPQWGPTPDGQRWQNNLDHALTQRPLYRLTVLKVNRDAPVIVHEGEKAVHAAVTARLPGVHTTSIGGAKNAHLSDWSPVHGRQVVICPDCDDAGEQHAAQVAGFAQNAGARSVQILRLPGLPPTGDVVEWVAAGGMPDDFQPLLEQAEPFVFVSPSKTGTLHEREFNPLSAGDFLDLGDEDEAVEWVLEDYLPAGGLVLLAGKPKEWKTTLTYELAVRTAQGVPFLNRTSGGGGILILALEEHPRDVRLRLRALGSDRLTNLFVSAKPLPPNPDVFQAIRQFVIDQKISLVLVDTLGAFWKIREENDAAEVTQAMKPFLALARETGACVLLIHHARKSEGSHGDEIRGSGAIFSTVDIGLILKRHEVQTQRYLHAVGRYPETPHEMVLELTDTGYVALGDPATVNKQARREKVKAALSSSLEDPATISQRAGVSLREGYRLLALLVGSGEASQAGKGRKGSPYRYRNAIHATPPVLGGALHESNSGKTDSLSCNPPTPCMNENSTLQFVEVIEDAR